MTSSVTPVLSRIRRFVISPGGLSMIEHVAFMLLSMITFAVLLRRFGLETVGLWTLTTALLNYSRIGDVWSKGLLSFIGEERGRRAYSDAASYASTTMTTGAVGYLLLMSIGGAAVYTFSPYLVPPEHVETVQNNLPLMVAAYWLIACSGNFSVAFVGFGVIWMRTLQKIGGSLLLLLGLLALDPSEGLTGILKIQLFQGIGMLVFGGAAFYGFVARKIDHSIWDRQKFAQLFRFGSKLFIVGGVQNATEPMIKILVSQFGGLALVAVLELVMRLIQGFRGLIVSLGQVIVTSFARHRNACQIADNAPLRDAFCQTTHLFLGSSLVAFSLLFAAGPLISVLFLDSETQAGTGNSFQIMLWVFGTAWFINTVASVGYFLMMSLRASRELFVSVTMQAGLIAFVGFPLGAIFGIGGVFTAVFLAFAASSIYLFLMASKHIHLQSSQRLFGLLLSQPSIFIPFAWATAVTMVWTVSPNVSDQPFMLVAFAMGLLTTGLLVLRYSGVPFLLRAVMDLKP